MVTAHVTPPDYNSHKVGDSKTYLGASVTVVEVQPIWTGIAQPASFTYTIKLADGTFVEDVASGSLT